MKKFNVFDYAETLDGLIRNSFEHDCSAGPEDGCKGCSALGQNQETVDIDSEEEEN
jgi:hypothetical protein